MRLLLDTHIWLWSLGESQKLVPRVRNELKNPENELWLSPISMWEAFALYEKGRLKVDVSFREWGVISTTNLREAPLTQEIVLASSGLSLEHRDPADRFLAATAGVLGLTLVTADRKLLALDQIATLANR